MMIHDAYKAGQEAALEKLGTRWKKELIKATGITDSVKQLATKMHHGVDLPLTVSRYPISPRTSRDILENKVLLSARQKPTRPMKFLQRYFNRPPTAHGAIRSLEPVKNMDQANKGLIRKGIYKYKKDDAKTYKKLTEKRLKVQRAQNQITRKSRLP